MNFTNELLAFQGAIISADHVHQFSKITARGGNEEEILDIITRLFTFLQDKHYVTRDGVCESADKDMRKFAFYLVLNGDFKMLEDLVELPGIDMAIWTLPTITKCLICDMFWGLHMNKYLKEIISLSYPTLALQILNPFIESIKNYSPTSCREKITAIAIACYKLIGRFNFYEFSNDYVNQTLAQAYEYFLRCITYFVTPPNEDKLNRLTEDQLYKYKGDNLYSVMSLILECLASYTSTEKLDLEGFQEYYVLTFKPESIKTGIDECKFSESTGIIDECLQKCNIALLDKCQALVMDVSVDIYCAWSEFLENGKSMQQSVGELCYLLSSKVQKIESLVEHPILGMLPQISRKPVDIHDIIKLADDETVLENTKSDTENKKLWLQVVINKESLLENKGFVECLLTNIDLIEREQAVQIASLIIQALKHGELLDEKPKQLGVKLFSTLDQERRNELISSHFQDNILSSLFELDNFKDIETEIFNKFISTSDTDLTDVFNVFIQNPYKTFEKIIRSASENAQQCDIMIKVTKLLEPYLNYYYKTDTEPCYIRAIQSHPLCNLETDNERKNFVKFIVALKNNMLLSEAKLLLLILMPNLHKGLLDKNMYMVHVHLQILDDGYTISELLSYRAPVLAMLAQVLEVARWSITTFDSKLPMVLTTAIKVQKKLFQSYEGQIPGKELTWLKQKLKKLTPLNMYYYRKLWNPPGNNYLEIITGQNNIPVDKLNVLLTKVLSSTIVQEWMDIWDSLAVHGDIGTLDIFYDSISILVATEKTNRNDITWSCIANCYQNLVLVTKNKFFKEPLTNNQVECVLNKIIEVINSFDSTEIEQTSAVFITLLSYIVERKSEYTIDITQFKSKINHEKFSTMFQQLFISNK